MRLKASATALALLLTMPALTTLGEKVDLRGPAPAKGQVTSSIVTTEAGKGEMDMSFQGQKMKGEISTKTEQTLKTTIAEVTEGEPTKVEIKFVESKTTTTMVIAGREQKQEDDKLKGLTLVQTKTDSGWNTTAKGGNFPAEAAAMMKDAGYVDPRIAFPDKKVGVGDTWTLKDEALQAMMSQAGLPGATFTGEMKFELVKIEEENGKKYAVIKYTMDVVIKMQMKQQGMSIDIDIAMEGKGSMDRNLGSYTTDNAFSGDMDMTTKMSMNGQPMMTMTAEMPFKTETQETRE